MLETLVLGLERLEERARLGERSAQRVDQPRPALNRSLSDAAHPRVRVQQVVSLLSPQLHRERAKPVVPAGGQRVEPDIVRDVVEPVTRQRVRPIAVAPLAKDGVSVLVGLASEGQAVRMVAGDLTDAGVERGRVPDLVLGDRRESDVLFDVRRETRPLGVAVDYDDLVVRVIESDPGQREYA